MSKIQFFTKQDCLLCDEALDLVELVIDQYDVQLEIVDIYTSDTLLEKYQLQIPVLKVKDEELYGEALTYDKIETLVQSACSSHPLG
ncbi:MAG TPA: glutaredoxin family protein [Pseudogracilibacillus sp.]|nr:glutaredoxin family protein [Pseudogracilibacillus sp.]